MNNWVKEIMRTDKAIVGLCHFQPLPGDPFYDAAGGMERVYEMARDDVLALQEGGIDAIQFTNEFSHPYATQAKAETITAMAALIGRLRVDIHVPFGANCIGDTLATISLCAATGALFTRGSYHGTWATNFGLQNSTCSEVYRQRHNLGIDSLKLVHYLSPESAGDVGGRNIIEMLKPHCLLNKPDALGIAGAVAGQKVDVELLKSFRVAFPSAVLFAVTGVNAFNADEIMSEADAAFVGTSVKVDGKFENPVDPSRVRELMSRVRKIR